MTKLFDEVHSVMKSAEIRKKLKWIISRGWTGYEKWLQHELAYTLEQRNHEVHIEHSVETNAAKTAKVRMSVDIALRLKDDAKEVYGAIELKVTNSQTSALVRSIQDLVKLTRVKSAKFQYRSVTAMAVVNSNEDGRHADFWKALKRSNKKNPNWSFEEMAIGIKGSSIYWLSWHVRPGAVEHGPYKDFVKFIRNHAADFGLTTVEQRAKNSTPKKVFAKRREKAKTFLKTTS
jgi:hypothetical protein